MLKDAIKKALYNSPLEVSINMKARYGPIVKRLKRLKRYKRNLSVLEVGSGSKGITRFFKHPVTGVDVEFQEHKNKYLKEIKINFGDKLPFKKEGFDAVVAVDCIEHIPGKNRIAALKEMKRVSKKHIMITCPFKLDKWDKRVLKKWPKDSATYKNIKEHFDCGIPSPKEIRKAFGDCDIEMHYGQHSAVAYWIKLMERSIVGKAFSRTILKPLSPILNNIKGTSRRYYYIKKA